MPAKNGGGLSRWLRSARDAIVALPHGDRRQRMVMSGLDAAYERAGDARPFDVETDKLVIFSDHHRGSRDGADDFLRCERAYRSALAHYLEAGHTLALLGDTEELWECRLPAPLKNYPDVLALERGFSDAGRLLRFYGNHDLVWSRANVIDKYLAKAMGGPVEVLEALRLGLHDGEEDLGELFLTHGHQGTPDSDLWAPLAMIPVRYVWPRLQRSVKFASTSPARDYQLRGQHDGAMFQWAKRRSEAPIRSCSSPGTRTSRSSDAGWQAEGCRVTSPSRAWTTRGERSHAARGGGQPASELSKLHAMLEFVSTADYGAPPIEISPPCYFNTGCCSFGDRGRRPGSRSRAG